MGYLISISGMDGSGKTSQCLDLDKWLFNLGKDSFYTHAMQPSCYFEELRLVAEKLSISPRQLFSSKLINLTYLADLEQIAEEVVRPTLTAGKIVIVDRYDIDCAVCTFIWGGDLSMFRRIAASFPKPDLHFYLDVSPQIAWQRIIARQSKPVCADEGPDILIRQKSEYQQMMSQYPDMIRIDANQSYTVVQEELREYTLQNIIVDKEVFQASSVLRYSMDLSTALMV